MLPDTQNHSVRDSSSYTVQRSYTKAKWEDEVTFSYETVDFHRNGVL